MKKMEEQFVTHNIAKELFELGFNKGCMGFFKYSIHSGKYEIKYPNYYVNKFYVGEEVAAPLWQQVIDWFEEKFNYHIDYNTHKKSMEYNVLMAINYQKILIKNKEEKCSTQLIAL